MWRRALTISVLIGTPLGSGALVAQANGVYRVQVEGVIEMGLAPYVERVIREASEADASAVIVEIETPGGRIDAAQRIVKAISNSDVPVYALVNQHAWSAGAMIALAADSIYMVPGSSIGAATPVSADGKKGSEKIVSAMRGEFRALAERRGLDPRIAEAMVDESVEVDGIIAAGRLLTLTADESVNLGLATAEVRDLDEVKARLGLADAPVVQTSANWAEQLVRFLSNPVVAPILLSLGTLGIIFEIKSPGFGVAGAVGLMSFAAFFGSHLLIGLAGWEEVILLAAGIVALGFEVFVVPGFGIAGVVAILCIGAAIFLSLIGNIPTWPDFARASSILAGAIMLIGLGVAAIVRFLPRSERLHGVFLTATMDRETGFIAAPTRSDLVGSTGETLTDLRPSGVAMINGERMDVVSEGGFVPQGARIRVVRSEAYRHVVTPV